MKAVVTPILAAAFLMLPGHLPAQSLDDVVSASVLTGWRMENGHHMAALRITLAPGWKTYWRAPGDAGIPPRFDWTGSDNLTAVTVHWPVPSVFDQNGLRSVGYSGDVVMPVEIIPEQASAAIELTGRVDIGVCQDICIPVPLELRASLPFVEEGSGAGVIRTALADRPETAAEAGVGPVTCGVEPISDGMRVRVMVDVPQMAGEEVAVVEFADPTVWVSEAEMAREGGALVAVADLVPEGAAPFALSREDLRITLLAAGRAIDIRGCTAER